MKWVKLAAGLVLLLIPFGFVDWRAALAAMGSASLPPLALALLVLALNMPLSALKWDLLLRVHGVRPGFWDVLRAYWISSFFSNYLPSNVGGDAVRLVVLRCEGRRAEVGASILAERLTGLAIMLGYAALALSARPAVYAYPGLRPLLWLLILSLAAGVVAAFLAGEPGARALERLGRGRSGRVAKLLHVLARVALALAAYRRRPGALVSALLLSVPFYAVLVVFQYLVLRAVGADLPLLEAAFVAPMIPLVGLLPFTPNGLGLVEGAFVLFFTAAGVAPEAALAGALLRRVIAFAVSMAGGVFWLAFLHRRPATGAPLEPPGSRRPVR